MDEKDGYGNNTPFLDLVKMDHHSRSQVLSREVKECGGQILK